MRNYRSSLKDRGRELRKNQSGAENVIWYHLRNRQLDGIKFQRQYAIGMYIVDFVARGYNLIVEIDGGQHNEDSVRRYDEVRTEFLRKQGYSVLRFWDNEVFGNIEGVLEKILEVVHSHPNLLSKREGNNNL